MKYDPNTGKPIDVENKNVTRKTNGFAIAGFVLSLLGCVGILGLIFSIIGLSKSKEWNDGKGLSIAGLIISILRILGSIVTIIMFSFIATVGLGNTTEACSKSFDCEPSFANLYKCKYKEGIVSYDVTCHKEELKENQFKENVPTTTNTTKKTTVSTTTTSAVPKSDKVNIYVFYGEGCPHCEQLFKYLNELEKDNSISKMYSIDKYEVWHDSNNAELMKKVYNNFGVTDLNQMGVPLYIIGDKHYVGFPTTTEKQKEALDNIKKEIKANYGNSKYKDVVEEIKKNNKA